MKFLSVRSVRTVAILLTLANASLFVYAGNKYGHWIEIGALCLFIQVLVFVFYLLVHIYFVWLNEQMGEMQNTFTHKTNAIDARLSGLDDKFSDMSNFLSSFKEGMESKFKDNSERIVNSLSEQSGKILNQNKEYHTELSNAQSKTNELLNVLGDDHSKMKVVLEHLENETANTKELLSNISNDFNKSNEQFTELVNNKSRELVDRVKELLHGLSEEVQINLRRDIRQSAKESKENAALFNSKLNSMNSRSSIAVNQLHELHAVLGSMKVDLFPGLKTQLELLDDKIAQREQLQKLFEQLFQTYNEKFGLFNSKMDKNHQESIAVHNKKQEETIKLMDQLGSNLKDAVTEVSPNIFQEIKPILDEIAEAKGTKKVIFEQLKQLDDSFIAQIDNLGQVNEDLQKSTLQTLNAAIADLDSLVGNKFSDSNEKSSYDLKNLRNELESAFENKLNSKIDELTKISASEGVVKSLHDQLLQEVISFRESFKKVTGNLGEKSSVIQTKVLEFNNSINNFEENLSEKSDRLQNSIFESTGSIKKIEAYLEENSSSVQKNVLDSNTILQKIEKLDAAMGVDKESKLLKQFISAEMNSSYERIDSLFSIHNLLDINSPLPVMHEWRISSDFATHLVGSILKRGKGNVVDIGSGVSTILAGYALKKNNAGKVYALEHSVEYYEKTLALIKEHKLENHCELYLCPLKKYVLNNKEWLWYDIAKIKLPTNVILINVDGPPGATQPMARYPAVPILKNIIGKNTVILLDDGKREDERKIAEAWEEELSLKKEYIKNYKGLYELAK